jgi:hypothetical protein
MQSLRRSWLVVLIHLVWYSSPSVAQTIERPASAIGDSWTYRVVDHRSGSAVHTEIYTVTKKLDDGYEITIKRSDRPERIFKTTLNLNTLADVPGHSVVERQFFDWPLVAGKTWEFGYPEASQRFPGLVYQYRFKARVVGTDEVTVPAGKFQAVKIEYDGGFNRSEGGGYARATSTIWYAADVKRSVKSRYAESDFSNRPFSDINRELVSYSAGK